ncbi:MAG: hypothetical protein WAN66_13440 [Limnoraphis robusta]|jgi:hypothetical protein|uniref:Uncharacterized protein n=1 Tax=Limnoraphis robusta CS-951 TaxID=1637645 RepID=A0A0F5YFZ9_9CYAN|nr:hypothetical protein [Limnoraphis robusta]KKD37135.1 hypothetical protein WN50_16005 [Limnoraphis robusta CS-951]MCG5057392.1 hypothetical protein [Limnoraphis sp. WC205]
MGCFIRLTTAATLVLGVQLVMLEVAHARYESEPRSNNFQVCETTSSPLESVICPLQEGNTDGGMPDTGKDSNGGGR